MSGLPSRRLGLSRGRPRPTVGIEQHPALAGAGTPSSSDFPQSFNLWDSEAPCFDQLDSEFCFAHALVQGVYTNCKASGRALPWVPSPLDVAKKVRALARAEGTPVGVPLPPLTNVGATDTDTFSAAARFGVVPMGPVNPAGNTDVTDANMNDEPSLAGVEAGTQHLVVGPYSIAPDDPALIAKIQAVLYVVRAPLWVGNFADSAEMNWTDGNAPLGVPNTADPTGGGHATLVDGWELLDGAITLTKLGSWSASYGVNGRCLASQAWARSGWAIWPVVVTPVGGPS